jgi:hypothetical protein
MTRRSDLTDRESSALMHTELAKAFLGKPVNEQALRKPGMIQRFTLWSLTHLGVLMGVSLVGWLLFLALLALMLLPGCSSDGLAQRESAAFQATERALIYDLTELQAGRMTAADFAADLRLKLDNLQAAEQGERSNAGTSWIEVVGTALGSSTLVGGLLHVARNVTRKRDLQDVTDRLDELEKPSAGGAA